MHGATPRPCFHTRFVRDTAYINALEQPAIKHFNTGWPNSCNRDAASMARARMAETMPPKPAHVDIANPAHIDTANSARILEFAESGFYKLMH